MTKRSFLALSVCTILALSLSSHITVAQKSSYGLKEKALHQTDSLLDAFFSLRYTDLPAATKGALLAQKLAEKNNDRENYAIATECIGLSDYYRGDFQPARHNIMKALLLYEDLAHHRGISSACNNLALIEQDQGNLNQAIALYNLALKADSLLVDSIGTGYTLNNLGTTYLYKGEFTTALRYLDEAKKYSEATGDYELKINTLINTALFYHEFGQQEEALALYATTLELAKKSEDNFTITVVTINIGDVHRALNQFPEAWKHYQTGLEMAHEIESPEVIADCLSNMGQLLQKQGNTTKANEYFIQALKIYEELGSKKKIGSSLTAMGQNLITKEYHEKAIGYFHQSLHLVEKIGALPEMAGNYRQLTLAWAAMNQLDSATHYLEKYADTRNRMTGMNNAVNLPALPDSISQKVNELIASGRLKSQATTANRFDYDKANRSVFGWIMILSGLAALITIGIFGSLRKNKPVKVLTGTFQDAGDRRK